MEFRTNSETPSRPRFSANRVSTSLVSSVTLTVISASFFSTFHLKKKPRARMRGEPIRLARELGEQTYTRLPEVDF